MISGSSFFGLLTRELTGHAFVRSAGKGPRFLFLLYRSNHRDALPEELRASSVDLRDKFVRFAGLGEKVWNTFSHRCNITCKTVTDRAKNTKGYITIPALHTSKIAPV
jgi:hypothetical protein